MWELCGKMGKRLRHLSDWETALSKSVARLKNGWTVRNDKGSVVLSNRALKHYSSIGFKWEEQYSDEALARIKNIFILIEKGESFKEAVKIANG